MASGAALAPPDLPDQSTPQMPPIQGASPAAATSPSQPAAPGAGATPPLAQPQQGRSIEQGTGKGEIQTPPVKMKYNEEKLKKAQTTLDVLNAATADSRREYMSWWQQQHGDIDDKYDHLRSQMGARPSDDEPQTKKEKFAALLEFGLHLMKNSATPTANQGAVALGTLSDEHDANAKAHADSIAKRQGDYDTQANAIESARDKAQQGIGTPAQAMKASSDEAKGDSAAVKSQAGALKDITSAQTEKASAMGPPTYAVGPGGVVHAIIRGDDGSAHAEAVTGIDGKPFVGRVLGRATGTGVDKNSQDPAAVRTHKYMVNVLGMDPDTAAKVAFKPKTGSPDQDHASIYKSVMTATFGDDEKAKRVADQYILDNYGAGAITRQHAPMVQPHGAGEQPPDTALQGLKAGDIRDFGKKGKWTRGIDGKPMKVGDGAIGGGGPPTLQ